MGSRYRVEGPSHRTIVIPVVYDDVQAGSVKGRLDGMVMVYRYQATCAQPRRVPAVEEDGRSRGGWQRGKVE